MTILKIPTKFLSIILITKINNKLLSTRPFSHSLLGKENKQTNTFAKRPI